MSAFRKPDNMPFNAQRMSNASMMNCIPRHWSNLSRTPKCMDESKSNTCHHRIFSSCSKHIVLHNPSEVCDSSAGGGGAFSASHNDTYVCFFSLSSLLLFSWSTICFFLSPPSRDLGVINHQSIIVGKRVVYQQGIHFSSGWSITIPFRNYWCSKVKWGFHGPSPCGMRCYLNFEHFSQIVLRDSEHPCLCHSSVLPRYRPRSLLLNVASGEWWMQKFF